MIEYVTGDLFESDLPAIAHGCNTRGVMGAGIARQMQLKYPDMYLAYRDRCSDGTFALGNIFAWRRSAVEGPTVFNLATQVEPGPYADLGAIAVSVTSMLSIWAIGRIGRIGIPRIGAGIGGLAWGDVESVLEMASAATSVDLVVYTLPAEVHKFSIHDRQIT